MLHIENRDLRNSLNQAWEEIGRLRGQLNNTNAEKAKLAEENERLKKLLEGERMTNKSLSEGDVRGMIKGQDETTKKPIAPPPNLKPKSQWISVKDELPEETVMVWISGEETIAVAWVGTWSDGRKEWLFGTTMYDGMQNYITHWMPLPEPPVMEGE